MKSVLLAGVLTGVLGCCCGGEGNEEKPDAAMVEKLIKQLRAEEFGVREAADLLPLFKTEVFNFKEVLVARNQCHVILQRQRCDPDVVVWNGTPFCAQTTLEPAKKPRGFGIAIERWNTLSQCFNTPDVSLDTA